MSIIDQLIKIKKEAKNEDILHIMEEIVKYEKLSKLISFKDASQQASIQKKLPFLWNASQKDIYAQTLLIMAGHICSHLTGTTPPIVNELLGDMKEAHQRRLKLMQNNSLTIEYHSLSEYDHSTMEEKIVGIYIEDRHDLSLDTAILIITEEKSGYDVYQGYYNNKKIKARNNNTIHDFVMDKYGCRIAIQMYSPQGNNSYPFAQLRKNNEVFSICMPDNTHIEMTKLQTDTNGEQTPPQMITLTQEQQNRIALNLVRIEQFADALLDIICLKGE